jgi:hypothetical protein
MKAAWIFFRLPEVAILPAFSFLPISRLLVFSGTIGKNTLNLRGLLGRKQNRDFLHWCFDTKDCFKLCVVACYAFGKTSCFHMMDALFAPRNPYYVTKRISHELGKNGLFSRTGKFV